MIPIVPQHGRLLRIAVSLVSHPASRGSPEAPSIIHPFGTFSRTPKQCALQLRNAKADEQLWTSLHNMYAGTAEDQKQPSANGLLPLEAEDICNDVICISTGQYEIRHSVVI